MTADSNSYMLLMQTCCLFNFYKSGQFYPCDERQRLDFFDPYLFFTLVIISGPRLYNFFIEHEIYHAHNVKIPKIY